MAKDQKRNRFWVLTRLKESLKELILSDAFLIKSRVNERSVTHMLAVHMKNQFKDYDVDCEYNRAWYGDEESLKKKLVLSDEKVSMFDLCARTVFPDIIVHKREDGDHNLLIVECKYKDVSNKHGAYDFDFAKLNAYLKPKEEGGLGYCFSAFIRLDSKDPSQSVCLLKGPGEIWRGFQKEDDSEAWERWQDSMDEMNKEVSKQEREEEKERYEGMGYYEICEDCGEEYEKGSGHDH